MKKEKEELKLDFSLEIWYNAIVQKLSAQLKKEGELMLEVDKNQYKEFLKI